MLSTDNDGSEAAWVTKKKSGPRPAHAVPSLSSLASKLAVMAARRPGEFELAKLINLGAESFSAAKAEVMRRRTSRNGLHIDEILYAPGGLLYAKKFAAVFL